ncbi:MFS transporter [Streptomyces albiflavescens]|uniref:MFS transporter n=2 Tax=Streptomyces albiflavescens TaxID=1623582 RepID=A0A917Y0L6_9ACTN|nr:MFS transporter [Streptomyces albiflavescens]
MVTAGILPLIAGDLDVSISVAGQMVTVFALSYAVLAPVLATVTARWPRRRALLTALTVFSLANALTALAPSYGVLLATRVLAAAGAAFYTPTANAVATALVPPERRGRAIAVVMGGLTVATALGVPLGTWIGRTDWRLTMWLVTGLGVAAFAGLALLLRELPQPAVALTLRDRLMPLADPRVLGAALTTFLVFLAFQTSFIYYTVATFSATGGDQDRLTLLLLVSGIASVGGSSAGGRLVDKWGPRAVILTSSTAYVVLAAASPWTLRTMPTALAASALTPLVGWSVAVALITRVASLDPANAPVLVSLNSSALYLGMAAAGGTGSLAIALFGDRWFLLVGAALMALATGVAAVTTRAPTGGGPRRRAPEATNDRTDAVT